VRLVSGDCILFHLVFSCHFGWMFQQIRKFELVAKSLMLNKLYQYKNYQFLPIVTRSILMMLPVVVLSCSLLFSEDQNQQALEKDLYKYRLHYVAC